MMSDAITQFATQFSYEPEIINAHKRAEHTKYILVGMGGSHLAADLLTVIDPSTSLYVHTDYGLPALPKEQLKQHTIIASSYSGNTEEVVMAYDQAKEMGLDVVVIAVGGKLIEKAKADEVAYIALPDTGIQPRSALGFSLLALCAMMDRSDILTKAHEFGQTFDSALLEQHGKNLAQTLKDHVPVIYTSQQNQAIAYNWKIKLNETGKVPAFYNVLPELNHNEMTGFDVKEGSAHLSQSFHFLMLKDKEDHPKVQKRMEVLASLYKDRNLPVTMMDISHDNPFEKIFTSLVIADWLAVHTADMYGLESEQVPMVEEFKKLIA